MFCVNLESINTEEYLGYKIQKNPNLVTTHINKGFVTVEKVSAEKSYMQVLINIDIHLDYIPERIFNFGAVNICSQIIDFIKKAAE